MPRYSYNEPRQMIIPEMSERYLSAMNRPSAPRVGGPRRVVGAANWGKSPVSSSPTTSKNLGIKNINRSIQSADQTIKEVKGVTAGLKNFLNNFGESGQGYSDWLTSWGLGKPRRARKPKMQGQLLNLIKPLLGMGHPSDCMAMQKDLEKLVKKHIKRRGGALDMSQYSGNTRQIANNSLYADWATRAVEKPLPNVTYIDMAPSQRGENGELL
jgi:hypothetical protein